MLERLMLEHRRIGSPLPAYLRPGADGAVIRQRVEDLVAADPPAELIELFGWHDGTDHARWKADDAGVGYARFFGDAYFAPFADCERAYRQAIEIDESTALFAPDGLDASIWRKTWFPALSEGGETYAIECQAGSMRQRVFDVVWHPPIDTPPVPRFLDLTHLVSSVVRRFEAGGYWWDPSTRFLDERPDILLPLYEQERKEVAGTL